MGVEGLKNAPAHAKIGGTAPLNSNLLPLDMVKQVTTDFLAPLQK